MQPFGRIKRVWVLAFILELIGASCTVQVGGQGKELDASTKTTVQLAYGKLPLHFEANQGQTDEQVKFLSRGSGYTLFLTSTETVLTLRKPHKNSLAPVSDSPISPQLQKTFLAPVSDSPASPQPYKNSLAPVLGERVRVRGVEPDQTESTVLCMKLLGANTHPQVMGLDELPGKSNYFIGNDPKKWHTNVPTYARVQYRDIYPGIDLIYYGNQRQLEYDFVVTPGADPEVITLAFEGLVGAGLKPASTIDTNGDLILHTAGGEIRLHKPRIYQEINGVKQPIPGGYVLLSPQSSSLITFHVAAYDTSKPLIIDPVLSYSTYLGGSSDDYGRDIAVDSSGNTYVTGYTGSADFPTANPLQRALGGGTDAFVAKIVDDKGGE